MHRTFPSKAQVQIRAVKPMALKLNQVTFLGSNIFECCSLFVILFGTFFFLALFQF